MSKQRFDDNCPGCRPALVDPDTGKAFPSSHPLMQAVDRVWAATTRQERESFHNFCCLNSREPIDIERMAAITARIQTLAKAIDQP